MIRLKKRYIMKVGYGKYEIIAVFELHSQQIASTSYMKESGVLRTNKLTIPI